MQPVFAATRGPPVLAPTRGPPVLAAGGLAAQQRAASRSAKVLSVAPSPTAPKSVMSQTRVAAALSNASSKRLVRISEVLRLR